MHICLFPEYFNSEQDGNLDNLLSNHVITLRVLENVHDDDEMHDKELYWIDILKPYSQKCDGTDHIRHLNERL